MSEAGPSPGDGEGTEARVVTFEFFVLGHVPLRDDRAYGRTGVPGTI